MKVQITNISGHQTSKIFGLIFFVLTLPFGLIGLFFFFTIPDDELLNGKDVSSVPFLLMSLAPLLYGVMFYFMQRMVCFVYNLIAKRFGGFEFEMDESNESQL